MTYKSARRWEQLELLLGGYLHQDFTVEHGGAPGAVRARLATAPHDDQLALSSEWRTFLNVTAGMNRATRSAVLRDIAGGSWDPQSDEEFDAVSRVLLELQ
ncbi:MAG TPA: hypothetical protein VMF13_01940 [Luteitalea sp.]|nr:hypothetical protein [Luteitalea sp.]